jgi:hypothetical protein
LDRRILVIIVDDGRRLSVISYRYQLSMISMSSQPKLKKKQKKGLFHSLDLAVKPFDTTFAVTE